MWWAKARPREREEMSAGRDGEIVLGVVNVLFRAAVKNQNWNFIEKE